jgi:hypothetical protein
VLGQLAVTQSVSRDAGRHDASSSAQAWARRLDEYDNR